MVTYPVKASTEQAVNSIGARLDQLEDIANVLANRSCTVRDALWPRPEDPQACVENSAGVLGRLERILDRLNDANRYLDQSCESLGV